MAELRNIVPRKRVFGRIYQFVRLYCMCGSAKQWREAFEHWLKISRVSILCFARDILVTVFIQNLEYYKAVLFFTSNRLSEFDKAVCGRVHLFMKYNNPEDWARRDVCTTFLNRANTNRGPPSTSAAEMDRLVAFVSNVRQVCPMYIAACLRTS